LKRPFLLILTLLTFTGCSLNQTEYRVEDRFHRVNATDPDRKYFLMVELPPEERVTDEKGTNKFRDVWISEEVWKDCYLEDLYIVKKIGRDKCVRTEESRLDLPPKQ
jgi:hypothetical protein